jgi:hypothetical protein
LINHHFEPLEASIFIRMRLSAPLPRVICHLEKDASTDEGGFEASFPNDLPCDSCPIIAMRIPICSSAHTIDPRGGVPGVMFGNASLVNLYANIRNDQAFMARVVCRGKSLEAMVIPKNDEHRCVIE